MKKLLILSLLLNNQINSLPTNLLDQIKNYQKKNIVEQQPSYSPLHTNAANTERRELSETVPTNRRTIVTVVNRPNDLEEIGDCLGYTFVAAGSGCILSIPIMICTKTALPIIIPVGCVTGTSGFCLEGAGCGILLRNDGE